MGRLHYAGVAFVGGGATAGAETEKDNVWISSFEVINLPAYETGFEGILGLDFLTRYKGVVDFGARALALTKNGETRKLALAAEKKK